MRGVANLPIANAWVYAGWRGAACAAVLPWVADSTTTTTTAQNTTTAGLRKRVDLAIRRIQSGIHAKTRI